jgi:lysyl-tRNA synthetase class 2
MSTAPDRLEAVRIEKLQRIQELGHDPFGQRFDGHQAIHDVRGLCPAEIGVEGPPVRVAGRILRRNDKGKLKFFHIQDMTGQIQLMVSKADISEETWKLIEELDLGDLVGIDGPVKKSKTGEITVFIKDLKILCKSLAQPPEKYHGVEDMELLLRHRHLDLIYNEGVLDRMLLRGRILDSVRQTLRRERFLEVETPVLHAIAGGAAARPFITHHNALDIPLYLRIALELHLKRLMVGGIERVYEMARVFRNEGIDATHNPEFTMIEIYQAYGDYESMMDLTQAIFTDAVRVVLAHKKSKEAANPPSAEVAENESITERLVLPWGDKLIDFSPENWKRETYSDLFKKHVGVEMSDQAACAEVARKNGIETNGVHPDVVISELFERFVEDSLVGPTFVIDYPAAICPLTKRKRSNPAVAERFELFIDGMELANAYTELNDPILQEELFRTQLAGQSAEDSMAKMDMEFVKALKCGMPPAGGLGIGIDRLVMLLTNSRSIRDVIFFPLLRPEVQHVQKDGPAAGDGGAEK